MVILRALNSTILFIISKNLNMSNPPSFASISRPYVLVGGFYLLSSLRLDPSLNFCGSKRQMLLMPSISNIGAFSEFTGFEVGFGSFEKFILFIVRAPKVEAHNFSIRLSRLYIKICINIFPCIEI